MRTLQIYTVIFFLQKIVNIILFIYKLYVWKFDIFFVVDKSCYEFGEDPASSSNR